MTGLRLPVVDVRGLPTIDPEQAACRGMEVLDFVGDKDRMTHQRIADAKAVCATCTQVEPCLAFAIAANEHGVWGGTTRRERDRMASARNRPDAHGRNCTCPPCKEQQREYHRAYRRRQREKGLPS